MPQPPLAAAAPLLSTAGGAGGSDTLASEEPLSLRRLRESLASLEQLERQRTDLRQHYDDCPFAGVSYPAGLRTCCNGLAAHGSCDCCGCGRAPRETCCTGHPATPPTYGLHLGIGNRQGQGGPHTAEDETSGHTGAWVGAAQITGGSGCSRPARLPSPVHATTPTLPRAMGYTHGTRGRSVEPLECWDDEALQQQQRFLRESLDGATCSARGRADRLESERDEAVRKVEDKEAEVRHLTRLVDRLQAERSAMEEDQQRERDRSRIEAQRLGRERLEALQEAAAVRTETLQFRARSEALRGRLETTLSEQRQQLERLGGLGDLVSRDFEEQSSRVSSLSEALYSCLQERTTIIHFLVDVLMSLQSIVCDPALIGPMTGGSPRTPGRSTSATSTNRGSGRAVQRSSSAVGATQRGGSASARERSPGSSCERGHRHSGCFVCGGSRKSAPSGRRLGPPRAGAASTVIEDSGEGSGLDQIDVPKLATLSSELVAAARDGYGGLARKLAAEADRSARVAGVVRGVDPTLDGQPSQEDLQNACNAWMEQLRVRRRSLEPCIDWADERAKCQSLILSLETKLTRLARLRQIQQPQAHEVSYPRRNHG